MQAERGGSARARSYGLLTQSNGVRGEVMDAAVQRGGTGMIMERAWSTRFRADEDAPPMCSRRSLYFTHTIGPTLV